MDGAQGPALEAREVRLRELKRADTQLRDALSGRFDDDCRFSLIAKRIVKYAEALCTLSDVGIERARTQAALENAVAELQKTSRGKLTREFMHASEAILRLEEEIYELKK